MFHLMPSTTLEKQMETVPAQRQARLAQLSPSSSPYPEWCQGSFPSSHCHEQPSKAQLPIHRCSSRSSSHGRHSPGPSAPQHHPKLHRPWLLELLSLKSEDDSCLEPK